MSLSTRLSIFLAAAVLSVAMPLHGNGLDACLGERAEDAWNASWGRFYKPETRLFYDYLTGYERGKELAHLPTAEEVKRQFPNTCGYGTGMEDCMISAGVMLDMIVDRYAVTREENMRDCAREIIKGIRFCALGHGYPGFVARGVCHEDLKSIYISSSRDQYTHVIHGLWAYFRSPLPNDQDKAAIAEIVTAVADRMLKNVTTENDYDSLRANGTRDDRGISRMWQVEAHEAARLPMIYAAAWEVTGRDVYHQAYRKYIAAAAKQTLAVEKLKTLSTWGLLQMQGSLELLSTIETDEAIKQQLLDTMAWASRRGEERARNASKRSASLDLTEAAPDWRLSGGLVPPYRTTWYCIREAGEALLAQAMDRHRPFAREQQKLLRDWFARLDFDRVSSCGIFHLQGAYWKARRRGYFDGDFTDAQYQEMTRRLTQACQHMITVYTSPKTHLVYAAPLDKVAPARLFTDGFMDPDLVKEGGGYGNGMADCAIVGGVLLSMLVDQHAVTADPALAPTAHDTFKGLKLCATVHGVPGFVARGVCEEDGKSVCLTSSRDQYTHFVHGLWRYARSPLCTDATRDDIRMLMRAVADRMLKNVTPENDYDFLRADNTRDPRGICRMWHVRAHEAARLPMIYAAAWDLCRDEKYHKAYREYLAPAVEQSLTLSTLPQSEINRWMPNYTLLQMQSSLELLLELETDAMMRAKLIEAMQPVARMAAQRAIHLNGHDDRSSICASGETLLAQLMAPGVDFTRQQKSLLHTTIMNTDPARAGSSRIVHVGAAFWRARRNGILTRP